MASPNNLKEDLSQNLRSVSSQEVVWNEDAYGNPFGWIFLPGPEKFLDSIQLLAKHKARLCTVSAYAEERADRDKKRAIAYHFILGQIMLTITVRIYHPETLAPLPIPSITPWFHNADWNEREFKEMFNIDIVDHPNPRRLFLDERLDAGVMTSLIPFSAMLNGAGSKDLWEKVMAEKTGCTPENKDAEKVVEPAFTPVEKTAV